ncbi:MAG: type II secretion system F family protein [Acidimicrobiaceae bacterium]|nr:type II secretion system F family protein [Acidimicrobiaceae bacterium]MDE0162819.1 type II secretion system F family protein [Acidimicrobiaceae bacterium]
MGVALLPLAAAALLVLTAFDASDAPRRAARRRLRAADRSAGRDPAGRDPAGALSALGRRLSGGAVEPEDEALVGVSALVTAAVAVALGPASGLLALSGVVVSVAVRRRSRRRRRVQQVERHLPEVIDLLGLMVGAGRPTVTALADVGPRVSEPFRSELLAVVRRTAAGEPFVDSVRRLRDTLGASVSPVVHAVTAAEIDGTPLRPALQRAADEAHRRRRVRAQEAARRVPVLMLFPLVFCVLPAFCLLTVVPLLLGSVSDLGLAP